MITLQDVTTEEISFIPKSEYLIGLDQLNNDILLFTQGAPHTVFLYSLGNKTKLKEIKDINCRIISVKILNQMEDFIFTPSFSAGQIFLYDNTKNLQSIIPKMNCNKGFIRSASIFNDKIYYVFPNFIISTDKGGSNPISVQISPKDMYIDSYCVKNFQATILRNNNSYCLHLFQNNDNQIMKSLDTGFIPSAVTLLKNSNEKLLEPYVLATCRGESYVIHYKFSY